MLPHEAGTNPSARRLAAQRSGRSTSVSWSQHGGLGAVTSHVRDAAARPEVSRCVQPFVPVVTFSTRAIIRPVVCTRTARSRRPVALLSVNSLHATQNEPMRHRCGMFIQTQDTPNPNAMMFLPGQDVMGEVRPARGVCRHSCATRTDFYCHRFRRAAARPSFLTLEKHGRPRSQSHSFRFKVYPQCSTGRTTFRLQSQAPTGT